MHSMQPIATDDLGVCQLNSAILHKSGWTDQDLVCGEHSWGPMNIVLDGGSWSLHSERRGFDAA